MRKQKEKQRYMIRQKKKKEKKEKKEKKNRKKKNTDIVRLCSSNFNSINSHVMFPGHLVF